MKIEMISVRKNLSARCLLVAMVCLFFLSCETTKKSGQWGITEQGDEIVIRAGIFERKFQKSECAASSLLVSGENVVSGATSGDFSVTLWKASPNIEPQGLAYTSEAGVEQQNDEQNSTDALKIKKKTKELGHSVEWVDSLSVSDGRFGEVFDGGES